MGDTMTKNSTPLGVKPAKAKRVRCSCRSCSRRRRGSSLRGGALVLSLGFVLAVMALGRPGEQAEARYSSDDPVDYSAYESYDLSDPAEEPVSDVDDGVALANEAADLLLEIDDIVKNSRPGDECLAIVEIRSNVDRVWEIIGELREMELPAAIDERLNESVSSVSQVEADTLTVEGLCG